MKTVLTYGTFDLFHVGHLNVLERLRALGEKGKQTVIPYFDRVSIVQGLKCVDVAFPEENWAQKIDDIARHQVSIFGMGDDWVGKFDELKQYCEVVYLPRTPEISSTELKQALGGGANRRQQDIAHMGVDRRRASPSAHVNYAAVAR
jgi:glycerol-3-phosphate cytidylyltransferase